MECVCLTSASIDYEEFYPLQTHHVRASKQHRCYECRTVINKGDEYLLEKIAGERSIYTFKTCRDCESLRGHLMCDWIFGNVRNDIRSALEEQNESTYPWSKFSKLTPGAKDFVFNIIEDLWKRRF